MDLCAEISYDGGAVHSDLCPPLHWFDPVDGTEYRALLHRALDELLDRADPQRAGHFTVTINPRIKRPCTAW